MRRKIIITGLIAGIIVFAGSIVMIFINHKHTYGRTAMILISVASAFSALSFYLQLSNDKEKRTGK